MDYLRKEEMLGSCANTPFRVDPIDQTMLTYMDTGEVLSCDIVVLKDDKGNKIFVT